MKILIITTLALLSFNTFAVKYGDCVKIKLKIDPFYSEVCKQYGKVVKKYMFGYKVDVTDISPRICPIQLDLHESNVELVDDKFCDRTYKEKK